MTFSQAVPAVDDEHWMISSRVSLFLSLILHFVWESTQKGLVYMDMETRMVKFGSREKNKKMNNKNTESWKCLKNFVSLKIAWKQSKVRVKQGNIYSAICFFHVSLELFYREKRETLSFKIVCEVVAIFYWTLFISIQNTNPPIKIVGFGKIYFTPNLRGLEYITPQPIKNDFLPPELSKTGQITP
jgi:hypothetical protein